LLLVVLSLLVLKMTEITIRDLTAEGSLAYYTIKVKDFIYDGYASTLEGAFTMIAHNLKYDYRGNDGEN
jgi:hypothetical protein